MYTVCWFLGWFDSHTHSMGYYTCIWLSFSIFFFKNIVRKLLVYKIHLIFYKWECGEIWDKKKSGKYEKCRRSSGEIPTLLNMSIYYCFACMLLCMLLVHCVVWVEWMRRWGLVWIMMRVMSWLMSRISLFVFIKSKLIFFFALVRNFSLNSSIETDETWFPVFDEMLSPIKISKSYDLMKKNQTKIYRCV